MPVYDVVAWMFPLEIGLSKKHLLKVLALLPDDTDLIPFEIHERNSSAYGYATADAVDLENGLETIIDHLGPLVDDWLSESSEYVGILPGGKKVYMGCDFRTVIIGQPGE